MCTLTFIPKPNNGFILTSNRDEAPDRKTFPPTLYVEDGVELLFLKDAVAGGTWIGCSAKKRVVSIMNGGFVAHKRKDSYRKSRGLVVKDLLTADDIVSAINNYDFEGIEPFTIIIVDWNEELRLFQLVWDDEKAYFTKEVIEPRIWSSSPLYPSDLKVKRENWFSSFIDETSELSSNNIWSFHKTAGEGNSQSDLIMDRGVVKTKSITQITKSDNIVELVYEDLESDEIYDCRIDF